MLGLFRRPVGGDIYIDLGTANTLVSVRGKGLVVNEPSVIAYFEDKSGKKRVLAVGKEAKEKIGRTPGNILAVRPLRNGVIADFDVTEAMLRYFLERPGVRRAFFKPRMVVSLPFGVTDVEKKAVKNAGMAAGAREVILIEEPMAAAIGAGLPVTRPNGVMVVDIGGGTSEVAVISLAGMVECQHVRTGGHHIDEAIIDYIRWKRGIFIGEPTAEKLKINIGDALKNPENPKMTINGRDAITGLPRAIVVSSDEIHEAIDPLLREIIQAISNTLERTPPELIVDIIDHGITLAGGGALIRNLPHRISAATGLPVVVAESPLLTIAKGGEMVLEDRWLLDQIAIH